MNEEEIFKSPPCILIQKVNNNAGICCMYKTLFLYLQKPNLGMSATPLQRLLPPDYEDGFSLPRVSVSGSQLKSSRLISRTTTTTTYA